MVLGSVPLTDRELVETGVVAVVQVVLDRVAAVGDASVSVVT